LFSILNSIIRLFDYSILRFFAIQLFSILNSQFDYSIIRLFDYSII